MYQEFESFVCDEGLRQESLKPLRQKGFINVSFRSLDGVDVWEVPCNDIKSSVDLAETLPLVKEKLEEKGTNLLDMNVVLKFKGEVIPNPLLVCDSHGKGKKAKKVTTKQFIPEGSTIEILKPEVQISCPDLEGGEPVRLPFNIYHNIKALQGFTKAKLQGKGSYQMEVYFNGKRLSDKQKIAELDFTQHTFVVLFLPRDE